MIYLLCGLVRREKVNLAPMLDWSKEFIEFGLICMTEEDNERVVIRGLRDVAAATTRISHVDPTGFLYYSGYNIDDLVNNATYEEVIFLLLNNSFG